MIFFKPRLFQITFSQKTFSSLDAIPWVRCASGNVYMFYPLTTQQFKDSVCLIQGWKKRADGADAAVLFFLLSCANFLAVYVQIR